MLSNIYWIVAILVMLVFLVNGVYMLVNNIIDARDFKRFKQKQIATLEALINERKGDK